MTTYGLAINNLKSFYFSPLRGDKEYLYNANGRKILDFQCGINGHVLGYNSHIVEKAIINQIHKGFFTQSNQFLNKEKNELCAKLCKIIGFYKNDNVTGSMECFNTATEANLYAIKIASKRYNTLCERQYNEIIYITSQKYQNNHNIINLKPVNIGIKYTNVSNISNIENIITEHTSAIILQLVQWENDITICNKKDIQKLRKICSYHKIGLIIDETNITIGNSGAIFMFQNYNIVPDIITLPNSLGGGLPMSLCITNEEFSHFQPQNFKNSCYSTICISIANSIISAINNENFLKTVKSNGKYLFHLLSTTKQMHQNVITKSYSCGLMFFI